MSEIVSFASLTRTALKDFLHNRSIWWMALPVGILSDLSSFFAAKTEKVLEGMSAATPLSTWIDTGLDLSFVLFLSLSFVFVLAQSPLRGIIVLLLQSVHLNRSRETSVQSKRGDLARVAKKAFLFESGFWVIIVLLGATLLVPSLLAWRFNQDALLAVSQLGLILFFSISLYLYLIKELSLLYLLLGDTSFRGSVDLGFRIFRRHSFLTLLFFVYLIMLAIIATFSISLASMALFFGTESDLLQIILTAPLFGLYFIFDQALRLAYFRKIASRPKTPAEKVAATKPTEPATGITNV